MLLRDTTLCEFKVVDTSEIMIKKPPPSHLSIGISIQNQVLLLMDGREAVVLWRRSFLCGSKNLLCQHVYHIYLCPPHSLSRSRLASSSFAKPFKLKAFVRLLSPSGDQQETIHHHHSGASVRVKLLSRRNFFEPTRTQEGCHHRRRRRRTESKKTKTTTATAEVLTPSSRIN